MACLNLAHFSQEEAFRGQTVEFRKEATATVVATAKLFTASQPRWTVDAPVVQQAEGYFADHSRDPQAEYIHNHIAGQPLELASEDGGEARDRWCIASGVPPDRNVGCVETGAAQFCAGRDNQQSLASDAAATAATSDDLERNSHNSSRGGSLLSEERSSPRVPWRDAVLHPLEEHAPVAEGMTRRDANADEGGMFDRLGKMFCCVQDRLIYVQQLTSCSPEYLTCQCASRDTWEPESGEPAPQKAVIPEEPLDSVFRPPCVAAAVARHSAQSAATGSRNEQTTNRRRL